ncbi:MAG: hypothetical protein ACE5G6_06550 [Terriglobia bacterium]
MKRQRALLSGFLVATLLGVTGWAVLAPLYAQENNQESEKKEDKEKKKSKGSEPRRTRTDREVLSRVLRNFVDGFEGLSPSSLRDWVERDKFYDYPRFEEGVTDFLRSVSEMRVFTREVNVQVEGARAEMIVEAEMVYAPRQDPDQTVRRRQRITIDFQRTSEGWLIVEINPRSFFLP